MSVRGSTYMTENLASIVRGGATSLKQLIENINPASLDLTVGDDVQFHLGVNPPFLGTDPILINSAANHTPKQRIWDLKLSSYENPDPEKAGVWVYPGAGVLLHTEEYVSVGEKAGLVLLKSSRGREFVQHMFAGWVDPGFHGQLVLEIYPPIKPIRIYRGQKIAQLILFDAEDVGFRYGDGQKPAHYQGQTGARGSWEQK